MSGSSIAATLEAIEAKIAAATPTREPTHAWHLHDGRVALAEAPMPSERVLRIFEVEALPDPETQSWSGDLATLAQSIVVSVRYHVPETEGGARRARLLAAADAEHLTWLLCRDRIDAVPAFIQMNPQAAQIEITRHEDTYTMRLIYSAQHHYAGGA